MEDYEVIHRLEVFRRYTGMTKDKLSKYLGISPQHYSNICEGKYYVKEEMLNSLKDEYKIIIWGKKNYQGEIDKEDCRNVIILNHMLKEPYIIKYYNINNSNRVVVIMEKVGEK